MTLYEAFLQSSSREGNRAAIIDLGTTLTYSRLRDNISRLSNLYQAEIPRGAVVAVLSGNGYAFAQTIFAVSNSGSAMLLLDPKDSDENILQDLRQLRIEILLVGGSQVSRAQDLIRRERLGITLIEIEKKRAGEYDTSFRALPDRPIKNNDPVLLVRLGDGVGGVRRYCSFSHKQIHASCISFRRHYRLTPADRMLTTMGWSHPFALTHGLLLPLFTGATCVVDPESPSVEEFVDFLAAQHVTRFCGAPKFYFNLLKYCAARKYTLPGVKSITVGMGTLSLALRKTYQLLKIPVLRCYGRPEAVWTLAMDEIEKAADVENTRSRPVQGVRIAVLTEDGEEIPGPDRREGRLAVTSEVLTATYCAPEKAPNENFRGTWLNTDEIARLEGEGDDVSVAVLGKMHDMLCVQGEYLSPRRIDQAALKVAGVEDAAGFVRLGPKQEHHFACAVVMAGARPNEKDLLARICEDLPNEYHPSSVHLVDSLPRDAFDSVNRLALQRLFSLE
ncbi:MAG: class I adenylate-forming enzyme family protein [Bdellovibrionota bacterium]